MTHRFSLTAKTRKRTGATWVPLGETGDRMWSAFWVTVEYEHDALEITLDASFDGDRVRVDQLRNIRRTDGAGVTPKDLTKLVLEQVVRDASAGAMNSDALGAHVGRRYGKKPEPDELRLVAAVYWFHHVTWGSPRRAVMAHWDLPPATASRWIRMARELYPMPGPHREEG